jgi:hypothetical protein
MLPCLFTLLTLAYEKSYSFTKISLETLYPIVTKIIPDPVFSPVQLNKI